MIWIRKYCTILLTARLAREEANLQNCDSVYSCSRLASDSQERASRQIRLNEVKDSDCVTEVSGKAQIQCALSDLADRLCGHTAPASHQ